MPRSSVVSSGIVSYGSNHGAGFLQRAANLIEYCPTQFIGDLLRGNLQTVLVEFHLLPSPPIRLTLYDGFPSYILLFTLVTSIFKKATPQCSTLPSLGVSLIIGIRQTALEAVESQTLREPADLQSASRRKTTQPYPSRPRQSACEPAPERDDPRS